MKFTLLVRHRAVSLAMAAVISCLLFVSAVQAAVVYVEQFGVSAHSTFSTVGWSSYVTHNDTSVIDWSTTNSEPSYISENDYAFFAPRANNQFDVSNGPGLMFTTEPGSFDIGFLSSLSLGANLDGSVADPSVGRLAIQVEGQWYASDANFSSTSNDGPGGAFPTETLGGIDFADGSNWRTLDVALGAAGSGELTLAGAAVGGTLTGDVTAYGVYAEPGNSGDHFRIDNYTVEIALPASQELIYSEDFEDISAGPTTPVDQALESYGWAGVAADGVRLTDSTTNPSRVVNQTDFEGDWRTYIGRDVDDNIWLTTDEVSFDMAGYEDDLAVVLQHRESNTETGDGYRIGFEVDGVWYVHDSLIEANTSLVEETLLLDGMNFVEWTGAPFDDATGWIAPALGSGVALPTGVVTGMGLMIVQDEGNEEFRFDSIQISGTVAAPVPEPTTWVLFALGMLGLFYHRRRRY